MLAELTEQERTPVFKSKQRDIMVKVFGTNDELAMRVFAEQMGRFPKTSSRGNQYIMVLCEIDSGGILVEPLQSKTAGETTKAFDMLMDRLAKQGIKTKQISLDKEISAEFKKAVDDRHLTYQLVPPYDHRHNRAE